MAGIIRQRTAQRMPQRLPEYGYETIALPPPKDASNFNKCHEVLATPELLEMILAQLPPADIIRSRRTNKQFRDAIDSSIPLKKRLFLLPSVEMDIQYPLCNPLLLHQMNHGYGLMGLVINPTIPLHPNDLRLSMQLSEKVQTSITVRFRLAKRDYQSGGLYYERSKIVEVQAGPDGTVRYAEVERMGRELMAARGEGWEVDYCRTEVFI
ncbi:hypothetical protein PRZ48_008893 [Zasmidium cellare]|uniref:F-box domain-containing protein n=1 Tax=Zasmidium cellare TaxID=395010 RepID=A0ABR0EGS5_ZASCE|nr:hypothetical protein PRZ48_008893 [Zasmidium cellare]